MFLLFVSVDPVMDHWPVQAATHLYLTALQPNAASPEGSRNPVHAALFYINLLY